MVSSKIGRLCLVDLQRWIHASGPQEPCCSLPLHLEMSSAQDPARQLQVSTDTEKARVSFQSHASQLQARAVPVKVRVSLPSPRDCKATMLQGAWLNELPSVAPQAVAACRSPTGRRERPSAPLPRRRRRCNSSLRMLGPQSSERANET